MNFSFLPKPKMLNEYEVVEHEFAMAFTHYVKIFNMMELNIGFCIRFLVNRADPSAAHPFLDRLTINGKLDVLKELVDHKGLQEKEGFKKDFDDWFKLVSKTRAARNRYIHGGWDIAPDVERGIRFTPMTWVDDMGGSKTERMTLVEFKELMKEMDFVFEQFSRLRKKYGI